MTNPWADALARFLDSRRSPATRETYAAATHSFQKFVERELLDAPGGPSAFTWGDVTSFEINRWRESLASKWRGRTVHNRLSAVKSFYTWAAKDEHGGLRAVRGNPFEGLERPRRDTSHASAPSDDVVRAMLEKVRTGASVFDQRDYAILLLMVHGGLRRAEIGAVRIGELAQPQIALPRVRLIRKGHGEDDRVLDESTAAACRRYALSVACGAALKAGELLFEGTPDPETHVRRGLSGARVYQIVRSVANRALSPEQAAALHPHALRHYGARLLQRQGVPIDVIQKHLRHERIQTTQAYLDDVTRDDAATSAMIGDAMKKMGVG